MNFFKQLWERIKDLFRANAHSALDKAEDPVKMADEYIRQLDNEYTKVKQATANSMATLTRLGQKRDSHREQADEWERKAVAAVNRGDDAMARSALERKRNFAATASEYAVQHESLEAQVKDFRAALTRIEQQMLEARAKRDLIKAKAKRADSRAAYAQAMEMVNGSGAMGDRLGAWEEKLDDRLYKAEAMAKLETDSLDNKFRNLEQETAVEDELAALKAKMGK